MTALTAREARRLRLRSGRLSPVSVGDVAAVAGAAAGLQAQDLGAAALSVRVRSRGLTAADVTRAISDERTVVRAWLMRGTLHLVPSEDLGWLLQVFGPHLLRVGSRRRAQLGLDRETCDRGVALVRRALADGPATRAEIVARLADWGMALEGQARIHLLGYAAAKEVVTYGPQRGAQSAFVLLDDWVKPKPLASREAALGELARRYLAAFGPARPHDFAVWSRLPVSDIRTGWTALESDLREVTIDGVPAWLLGDADPDDAPPVVRLLPAWDTYLLAYRDRAIDPTHAHRIGDGGILGPTVLVDGWIEGTWQIARRRSGVDISVDPFVSFDGDVTAAFEKEADDVRRFLGAPSERGATKP